MLFSRGYVQSEIVNLHRTKSSKVEIQLLRTRQAYMYYGFYIWPEVSIIRTSDDENLNSPLA